jgi:hypothetical protein
MSDRHGIRFSQAVAKYEPEPSLPVVAEKRIVAVSYPCEESLEKLQLVVDAYLVCGWQPYSEVVMQRNSYGGISFIQSMVTYGK